MTAPDAETIRPRFETARRSRDARQIFDHVNTYCAGLHERQIPTLTIVVALGELLGRWIRILLHDAGQCAWAKPNQAAIDEGVRFSKDLYATLNGALEADATHAARSCTARWN